MILLVSDNGLKAGDRLTVDQFRSKPLGRGDISLARKAYANLDILQRAVIDPAISRGEVVVGASSVVVKTIRDIDALINDGRQERLVKAACVLDRVDPGDHDSHAALKGCEGHQIISDKQLGKVRTRIAADLANKFGPIISLDSIF